MKNKTLHTYKDLIVWQRSVELATEIYTLTEKFPKEEIFGLSSQMRRAAVSISSNIAEGRHRGSRKDFINFLRISFSSGAELETQIEIAKNVIKLTSSEYLKADKLLSEVMKMLNVMIRKLNSSN